MSLDYVIQKNDNLTRVAVENGFGADWPAIYYHEINAEFREKHPDPFLIQPGSTIRIPNCAEKRLDIEQGKTVCLVARRLTGEQIIKAQGLHSRYCKLLDDRLGLESSQWYLIAQFAEAFAKSNPECLEGLDKDKLRRFKEAAEAKRIKVAQEIESTRRQLFETMYLSDFSDEILLLEPDARARLLAQLWERANESGVGRYAIAVELDEPSSLWKKHVLPVAKSAVGAFFEIVAEFTPVIISMRGEVYLFESVIHAYSDLEARHVTRGSLKVRLGATLRTVEVTEVREVRVQRLPPSLDAWKGNIDRAFAVIGFAIAVKDLNGEATTADKALSISGALATLLDNFHTGYVASVRTTHSKLHSFAAGHQGIVKGPGGNQVTVGTMIKGHQRSVASRVKLSAGGKFLGIAGAVIETVQGTKEVATQWSEGDIDAAIAYGISTVAGVGTSVLGILAAAGIGTSWAGVGLVILTITSLVAAIAAFFLEDDPDVRWVKNCYFGTSPDDDFDRQIYDLAVIVSGGPVYKFRFGDKLTIEFRPGFMPLDADVKLSVSVIASQQYDSKRRGMRTRYLHRSLMESAPIHLVPHAVPVGAATSGVFVESKGTRATAIRLLLSADSTPANSLPTVGGELLEAWTRWRDLNDEKNIVGIKVTVKVDVDIFRRAQWARHVFAGSSNGPLELTSSGKFDPSQTQQRRQGRRRTSS